VDIDKATAAVADLLTALDVDEGEHSARTPQRVARAWAETLAGYAVDPARHLAITFPAPPDPGLVILSGIRIRSTCAHHLLPQVQERLGYQVAATIQSVLEPVGVVVLITAAHGCISLRGVEQPTTMTTTQAITGCWDPECAEVRTVHLEHQRHR
jgi:GTP cyclohydrolase I